MNTVNNRLNVVISTIVIVGVLIISGDRFTKAVTGEDLGYNITLNSSTPATIAVGYGNGSESYGNGNVIINYNQVKDNASYHTELTNGSYIYNDTSTKITSITSVTATFSSGSLTLNTGNTANPTLNSIILASGVKENITGNPYFFKITSSTTCYLTSLIICYSCAAPTNHLTPVFNYEGNVASSGTHLVNTPSEGEGFVVGNDGFASTVDASHVPAAAPVWTFESDGYDKGMPDFEIESKVRFGASTVNTGVLVFRVSYSGKYDFQLRCLSSAGGWGGVQVFKDNALVGQHNNTSYGGLITDGSLTVVPDTDYIFRVRSTVIDDTNALVSVFVNSVKVIEIVGLRTALNANAYHAIGTSNGTYVKVDYFRGGKVVGV